MWEQSESWNLPYVEQYFPSFNAELITGYNFNNKHSLRLAIGYIESHVEASSINGKVDWNYEGYPLSIIYQYNLNLILDFAQPYVGGGLSFYWSTIQINADEYIGDKRSYQRDEIGLGLEGTIGLNFALIKNLNLLSEIKLRLSNASLISEESTYGSIEFTGFYFQLGLGYNL
jgi:outer membrane protein W